MTEDYKPCAEGEIRMLEWPSTRTYTWQLHEDITTYELALCMSLMAIGVTRDGWLQMDSMYDALPTEAQRHWRLEGAAVKP